MADNGVHRRRSPILLASVVVVALLIGGVIGFVVDHTSHHSPSTASPSSSAGKVKEKPKFPSPIVVMNVTPSAGATEVSPTSSISVAFSHALSSTTPKPQISPGATGTWELEGNQLDFEPTVPFLPSSEVTVTIPNGLHGIRASNGAYLKSSVVMHFQVQEGSVLRLQQLLSLLDYSPLTWTPTAQPIVSSDSSAQIAALYNPPGGTFAWRQQGWPAQLTKFWEPSLDNVFTQGLIMSFQADHGLSPNGEITPDLWGAILTALSEGDINSGGYNYAVANKTVPETLTIWHNGAVSFKSAANTGLPGAGTADGTFPVYSRLRSQVMHGTNLDGTKYADPVQFIAYFNGNDAVHYMNRSGYGTPQSLGCVELALQSAAKAWPLLAYGTLVTVEQ